jgi:Zinc carboxypeptidase
VRLRTRTATALLALLLVPGVHLWAQRGAPVPASVLGFEPCADYKLATYEQITAYFRTLAAASRNRMRLVDIGPTVQGRTQVMAIITSERNMRDLGTFKDISRSLALTRDGNGRALSDEQARRLARRGKAVVWIDFGLHSSEAAVAQTAPLVAFKAVTDESDEMKKIRDNVIFLLVPNMNPDGTTMVADWYMKHVGKAWENRLPELWHVYAGHDDNRDWYMMTQPETRNSARQLYEEWFPQIVYNQHQAGPYPSRIFVPPFDDPMNPAIPALVMRGVNLFGESMTRRLDREGKNGAISRIGFDTWWNGGMRTAPYFHNMIGLLTETAHPSATPVTNDRQAFPKTFSNGTPTLIPTTDYPSPYLGGEWHMRQSCDYMVTTSMAVLGLGAERREEWVYDMYRMGREAIAANSNETFLIPADQWDPGTAVKLVNAMRLAGVEIERATGPFSSAGKQYGAGTFVIRGGQPFAPYVKDLLTPQVYPDLRQYPNGPPKQPYDITGWTLPYQMGVEVVQVHEAVSAPTARVEIATPNSATFPDVEQGAYLLDPRANDAFTAVNRLAKARTNVLRAASATEVGQGGRWPAGAFVVPVAPGVREGLAAALRGLTVPIAGIPAIPTGSVAITAPRIGVYHAWGGNMDEGWTRWVLEQFEFPYVRLHDAEVRAGDLRARFDVVLLPDATYRQMLSGFGTGAMPDEYTGGMTARGVQNLRTFTERGGILVAMDGAAELPLTGFGLPIRNVAARQREADFFIPGTILRIDLDPAHPVAYGMPAQAAAFFSSSPAFAVEAAGLNARVVAHYPAQNLLMSGWLLGERVIAGAAAVMDIPLGRGHVVLLGFRTQHRGQPHGTFKLLFNSIFLPPG